MAAQLSSQQVINLANELQNCKFEVTTKSSFGGGFCFKFCSGSFTFSISADHESDIRYPLDSRWDVSTTEAPGFPMGKNDRLEAYQDCVEQVVSMHKLLNTIFNG